MTRVAKRLGVSCLIAAAMGLWPAAPAGAHPLGNFTINVHAGIVVRTDAIVVDHVVDLAEIPTVQERRTIDANLDERIDTAESTDYRRETCAALARGLLLRVDDRPVDLVASEASALSFPPGAGGLATMRLSCRYEAALPPTTSDREIVLVDRSFPDAIGWREVTAVGDRTTIVRSDVPATSATDRLTVYPADSLPLDVRRASIVVRPGGPALAGGLPSLAAPTGSAADPARDGGLLASLLGADDLTPLLVVTMIAVALGVGALHALGPGHGKTLIGAYLVGAGGTMRHAVGVGAAVSVMHTASVLALGLLVLSAERLFAPERVYPVLGLASGLIAIALGSTLLVSRIHASSVGNRDHEHEHEHEHEHGHEHGSASHPPLSRRGLVALAFSGGVLPSPSALVTLLAAVSLGRTALGLVLIVAFSIGLAASLIGVGALTLRARDLAARRFAGRTARLLPVASAAAIAVMGVFLTVQGATGL